MKFVKLLVFWCCLLILIFIFLEISLRIYNSYSKGESFFVTYQSQCIPDKKYNYVLNPDFKTVKITHNKYGFRGSVEDYKSDKDIYICLGGSTTYGTGVSDENTYPYLLEKKLGKIIINGGVPGYHSYHVYLKTKELIKKFHPQKILFYMGHNDINYYLDYKDKWVKNSIKVGSVVIQPGENSFSVFLKYLKNHSLLFNRAANIVIRYLFYKKNQKNNIKKRLDLDRLKNESINYEVIDNFQNNCENIIKLCIENNVTPVFIKQIYYLNPFNIDNEWYQEFINNTKYYNTYSNYLYLIPKYFIEIYKSLDNLKNKYGNKIVVISFNEIFYKKVPLSKRKIYFVDTVHLNSKGNNYLTDVIKSALNE